MQTLNSLSVDTARFRCGDHFWMVDLVWWLNSRYSDMFVRSCPFRFLCLNTSGLQMQAKSSTSKRNEEVYFLTFISGSTFCHCRCIIAPPSGNRTNRCSLCIVLAAMHSPLTYTNTCRSRRAIAVSHDVRWCLRDLHRVDNQQHDNHHLTRRWCHHSCMGS